MSEKSSLNLTGREKDAPFKEGIYAEKSSPILKLAQAENLFRFHRYSLRPAFARSPRLLLRKSQRTYRYFIGTIFKVGHDSAEMLRLYTNVLEGNFIAGIERFSGETEAGSAQPADESTLNDADAELEATARISLTKIL